MRESCFSNSNKSMYADVRKTWILGGDVRRRLGGHPQTELDECAAGDEAEAEPEGVQAADPVSPVAPPRRAQRHFHTTVNWLSAG